MWNINRESINEIIDTTESFQDDCLSLAKSIIESNPNKLQVQDIVNVWFFDKLAEFEVRLRQLEHKDNI